MQAPVASGLTRRVDLEVTRIGADETLQHSGVADVVR